VAEQHVPHRGRTHGHAGVTVTGFLGGVDGERADGVDAALDERRVQAGGACHDSSSAIAVKQR